MSIYDLGKKAKKLDQESIFTRMKIDKKVVRKIFWATLFYFGALGIMEIFL